MASSLNFDGGLTCALSVTDLAKSVKWYQDNLGFRPLYQMEEMGWCELATEVAHVNVGLSQVEKAGGPGNAVLTFGVKDIDQARQQLEDKGVRFDGPTRTIEGMVKLATLFDPDDNTLMLYEDIQAK
jgi:predicted enzyme related to lactoylglutathione lyase